jgi:hypothetical protein
MLYIAYYTLHLYIHSLSPYYKNNGSPISKNDF